VWARTWEEIDQAVGTPGGLNFGWRCKEGTHDYDFSGSCLTAQLSGPIAEYSHSEGQSVSGGFVYRGQDYPALVGRYFYADFVTGKIWSLYKTSTNPLTWSAPQLELDTSFNISAFGEDEDGELYMATAAGRIQLLADVNGPSPNLSTSIKQVSTPSADPQEVVTYTILLRNTGGLVNSPVYLSDDIPAGLVYVPGSFTASQGSGNVSGGTLLSWQGNLSASAYVTLTYQVTITGVVTGSIVNQPIYRLTSDLDSVYDGDLSATLGADQHSRTSSSQAHTTSLM
jgi:uncharacterized repeat protein (TIGR01451 family)